MFAGQYPVKLDEKGRFLIPSPIREQLEIQSQSVVFLKGQDFPLTCYPPAEWQKILERTKETCNEVQSRIFMHRFVAEATHADIDKAGRILIPGRLRKTIPIEDDLEVVIVGMYHKLEIWNPSDWRRYLMKNEDQFEEVESKLSDLL